MAPPPAAARARPAAEPSGPSRPSRASRPSRRPRATADRRRRERHYRLRRRDLVQDLGAGLLVAVLLFMLTAGLGVLALIDFALIGLLIGSGVIGRRRRRRRPGQSAPTGRRLGRPAVRARPASLRDPRAD